MAPVSRQDQNFSVTTRTFELPYCGKWTNRYSMLSVYDCLVYCRIHQPYCYDPLFLSPFAVDRFSTISTCVPFTGTLLGRWLFLWKLALECSNNSWFRLIQRCLTHFVIRLVVPTKTPDSESIWFGGHSESGIFRWIPLFEKEHILNVTNSRVPNTILPFVWPW